MRRFRPCFALHVQGWVYYCGIQLGGFVVTTCNYNNISESTRCSFGYVHVIDYANYAFPRIAHQGLCGADSNHELSLSSGSVGSSLADDVYTLCRLSMR